ncbi:MAG: helix-turn-helix transcriptional regulator [Hyphomonadaceae bacterium]|nr:helix-turn-helix transcriptional regulator [Hyphomonadaceae bacterium]
MAAIDRVSTAMDAKDEKFFKALGARLAAARNALDVTQVELAEQLGVAQQTLAHYEGGRLRIPVSVLLEASRVLRFSIDDMLSGRDAGRSKRGPASRLEQQLDAIARLPKAKQRLVADMLDGILQGS